MEVIREFLPTIYSICDDVSDYLKNTPGNWSEDWFHNNTNGLINTGTTHASVLYLLNSGITETTTVLFFTWLYSYVFWPPKIVLWTIFAKILTNFNNVCSIWSGFDLIFGKTNKSYIGLFQFFVMFLSNLVDDGGITWPRAAAHTAVVLATGVVYYIVGIAIHFLNSKVLPQIPPQETDGEMKYKLIYECLYIYYNILKPLKLELQRAWGVVTRRSIPTLSLATLEAQHGDNGANEHPQHHQMEDETDMLGNVDVVSLPMLQNLVQPENEVNQPLISQQQSPHSPQVISSSSTNNETTAEAADNSTNAPPMGSSSGSDNKTAEEPDVKLRYRGKGKAASIDGQNHQPGNSSNALNLHGRPPLTKSNTID